MSAVFSPDGTRVATAGYDHYVKIWNAESGAEIMSLSHDSIVAAVAYSHDGKMLATASWDQTAKIWNASDGKLLHTFAHNGAVNM